MATLYGGLGTFQVFANLSSSKEILLTMSKVLAAGAWLVKAIVMDGHHSHRYLKECLFGWFEKFDKAEMQSMDFWRDVSYQDVPKHCLPRLPMRLCVYADETLWCLPGPCILAVFIWKYFQFNQFEAFGRGSPWFKMV